MKILLVTTSYPRNREDMSGIFIKHLAVAMVRKGVQITVLAPGDRNACPEEMAGGIRIVRFSYAPRSLMRIAYGNGGIPENLKNYPYLYMLLPFFIAAFIFNGIRLARHHEIIHANWLYSGLFLIFSKWLWNKPIVVTLRGSDFRKQNKLFDFVINEADVITTVNKQWAKMIGLQRKKSKTYYVPNGVNMPCDPLEKPDKPIGSSNEIIVSTIGALRNVKGTDILVKTACKVREYNKNIRFVVAGPGNPDKYNIPRIRNISYLGTLPPEKVFNVYAASDIYFLPSRHEGRPNSLVEAMASGIPAVATKLPGVAEIMTFDTGIMVDIDDVDSMVEAICTLAGQPEKRKLMGTTAKHRIKSLSLDWDKSAETYLSIFGKLIKCAA